MILVFQGMEKQSEQPHREMSNLQEYNIYLKQ